MNKIALYFVILLVLVGLAFYLSQPDKAIQDTVELPAALPEDIVQEQEAEATVLYPVPIIEQEKPESRSPEFGLPELDNSDEVMKASLSALSDSVRVQTLFVFEGFIRHFVVTIDNLPGAKISQRFVFTSRPEGKFAVIEGELEDRFVLDERNYGRYVPFIDFADTISDEKLVELYVRYYPLFQEAYEELGYPDAYFNDRLVEVIDHLSSTPEVQGEIQLLRPKVFYQFADPQLEALSAGQKLLLRMGNSNMLRLKARLQSLRQSLTTLRFND